MCKTFLLIILSHFIFAGIAHPGYNGIDTVPHSAELLSRYIRHPSVTGNERIAGLFFSTVARQKGFHVDVLTDEPGSFNFTASLYPLKSGKPNVVLLNHIDVVPPTAELERQYTHPPFSGAIADGKVWGRGAIDDKGKGVMQLMAMEYYLDLASEVDLPYNITMLSVSGEETGGYRGAGIVTGEFMDYLNPVVVYGEGGAGIPGVLKRKTDRKLFGVSVAFKRSLWIELILRNSTSGHAAIPPSDYVVRQKNRALNRLLERSRKVEFSETTRNMFSELGRIEGGLRGLALRNIWLFRPLIIPPMKREEVIRSLITNTITVTSINTPPGATNQVPQEIRAVLDCRLLPEVSTGQFLKDITKTLDNEDVEIRILHERRQTPATSVDEYYYYMKDALKEVFPRSEVLPILAPAANDNDYFRAHGIPAYGILPVYLPVHLLETIHNVDERMPIESLEQGIATYRELIRIITGSKQDGSGT